MKKFAVASKYASLAFLFAFLLAIPGIRADEMDQATQVTFNHPVQIPGQILPAGTYWFAVLRDVTQPYVVRIYKADRTTVCATLLTVNAEQLEASDRSIFTLAGRPSSQTQSIVAWFYPGNTTGHEFLYSKPTEKELANQKKAIIVAQK